MTPIMLTMQGWKASEEMIPAGTIITEELIDAIRSPKGGFTAKALR